MVATWLVVVSGCIPRGPLENRQRCSHYSLHRKKWQESCGAQLLSNDICVDPGRTWSFWANCWNHRSISWCWGQQHKGPTPLELLTLRLQAILCCENVCIAALHTLLAVLLMGLWKYHMSSSCNSAILMSTQNRSRGSDRRNKRFRFERSCSFPGETKQQWLRCDRSHDISIKIPWQDARAFVGLHKKR